ncbi:MAG: hypothetical protein V4697_04165 [Patescibacteria group bacterium]
MGPFGSVEHKTDEAGYRDNGANDDEEKGERLHALQKFFDLVFVAAISNWSKQTQRTATEER